MPKHKDRRFEKWLPVKLTEHEVLERSRSLAQRHNEKRDLEAERARIVRDYGERLKNLAGEISRLSDIVASGQEHRNVECEEQRQDSRKQFRVVRLDTDEIVELRPMLESELQEDLF